MIVAGRTAMLFVQRKAGASNNPVESVEAEDAAITVMGRSLKLVAEGVGTGW